MGNRKKRHAIVTMRRVRRWRRTAMIALAGAVLAVAAGWWFWQTPEALGGTPKLVVDRDTVDLGYLGFETPARVVFTLTNAGDGTLRITDKPRVRAEEGC